MNTKKRVKLFKKYFKKRRGKANLDVHNLIESDYDHLLERTKKMLSLTEEDKLTGPIVIKLPSTFYEGEKMKFRLDKFEDGTQQMIYDQSLITTLLFGEKTLYYHQASIDHRTGYVGADVAGQVDYFDIVNLQVNFDIDQDASPNVSELFVVLGLSDASSLTMKLRHRFLVDGNFHEELLTEGEEKVIQTLRKIVNHSR